MLIDFDTSSSIIYQQTVSGTETFDGTEQSRANKASGIGDAQVIFQARRMGTDPNDVYTWAMIDPGRDNDTLSIAYDPSVPRVDIYLASSGGSITSTAADVVAALQARTFPITACIGAGDGSAVVVPDSGHLINGVDPDSIVRNTQYKFSSVDGGGLFVFDQPGNILVRQFEAKLASSVEWSLYLVNLDNGYKEIESETVEIATDTGTDVFLGNLNVVLSPQRALKFVAEATGVARAVVHKEPNFPLV